MGSDGLKEMLARLPVMPILALFVGYLAYDYYSFSNGELREKQVQLEEMRKEGTGLAAKLAQRQEFRKTLDQKRAEIRGLAQQLEQMKATLSDTIDVGAFIKMVVLEAARVGLSVQGIKPTTPKSEDFYMEQPFDLQFRAVYPQLIVFLERLANLETIVRVDNFLIKRSGSSTSQFVELNGTLELKVFKYLPSKADELGKDAPAAAPAAGGSNP